MEKIQEVLRKCSNCGKEAHSKEDLSLFVKDVKKTKFFHTKALCKVCNSNITREKRAGTYIYPDKTTRCKKCGLVPEDDLERERLFPKDRSMKTGFMNLCKPCNSLRVQKHQKDNPEMLKKRVRRYQISKYGISEGEYLRLLDLQNNSCAICEKSVVSLPRNLYIDHDHSCCAGKISCGKCVRGLLCPGCNFLLGQSEDRVYVLERAIMYLNRGAIS